MRNAARRFGSVCVIASVFVGCGGNAFSAASLQDASTQGDAGRESGSGSEASVADSGGGTEDAPTAADVVAEGGAGGKDATAACPDARGSYSVVITYGAGNSTGCGDLNPAAPQCIRQTGCGIEFTSTGLNGKPAINGSTDLTATGSFEKATLQEGTAVRNGCMGFWSVDAGAVMTIECGGAGTTQSCDVELTRKSSVCL